MLNIKGDMYRILIFSWNTQSINICETMDSSVATKNRTGSYMPIIGAATSWRYPGCMPDFFSSLSKQILDSDPDIVVIGFQEDRHPGSYFHSHLLMEEMPKLNYQLVKRTKLMGIGATSFEGIKEGDAFTRGIRVSIYAKDNLYPQIVREETEMRIAMGNCGQSEYVCSSMFTRGKGATVSYLILPGIGRIAIICAHLPFNSQSLIDERQYGNKMLRQNALNQNNVCFNNIIENLVLYKGPQPSHVIFFGDFNYRVSYPGSARELARDFAIHHNDLSFINNIYRQHDELIDQMNRKNIYEFNEGMDNAGPLFVPTCKMRKNRDNDNTVTAESWNVGKTNFRVPSWCDRILYADFLEDGHRLKCISYERMDVGMTMAQSDHAGVVAVFQL